MGCTQVTITPFSESIILCLQRHRSLPHHPFPWQRGKALLSLGAESKTQMLPSCTDIAYFHHPAAPFAVQKQCVSF